MGSLQTALQRAIDEVPRQALAQMVGEKLKVMGITLSESKIDRIVSHIIDCDDDTITFDRWRWWDKKSVVVDFSRKDSERFEQDIDHFIKNGLTDIISSITADLSSLILGQLRKKWRRESTRQIREAKSFRKNLGNRWARPLSLLRMFLTIANELGMRVNFDLRNRDVNTDPNLTEVMTRLHARACQITGEIICLLEAGFADGAMARWRTLHEVAAVALFIQTHGEELAERYVLHSKIESRNAAFQYQKFHRQLNCEPLAQAEIDELEKAYVEIVAKYGKEFSSPYGWAAHHLAVRKPTFADIEIASEIGHWRPYYKMASYNVHANPKGVLFRLGVPLESDILLAGPSNVGLTDPGQNAALSLGQISAALGTIDVNLDNLVTMQILMDLGDEIGPAFGDAQNQLEREIEELGDFDD